MVCEKCETKLARIVVPDKWKDGARNVVGVARGVRAGKTNKLVARRQRDAQVLPSAAGRRCRICHSTAPEHYHYCQACAYSKGICGMCGKKVLDTAKYRMSAR